MLPMDEERTLKVIRRFDEPAQRFVWAVFAGRYRIGEDYLSKETATKKMYGLAKSMGYAIKDE